ncbi:response regulator [Patescibacteria group bacterium]|nr:response regulator [Patescibacteria group bacterium]MBU2579636.1 response regulator [Patescibacteria group bacterium]
MTNHLENYNQDDQEQNNGGKGISVLIVEDDKFLRELLVRKLENTGFNVSFAVNGEEALKKIKEQMPQLILLDLVLPGIDGFEVLKQVKENRQMDGIAIIILSNLGQQGEVERGIRLGADDYLIKAHFTPDEIIQKAKMILKKKQG